MYLAPGTFAALAIALRATVDPGDEVIFISPPWFFYESMIAIMGATPVRVTLIGALVPARRRQRRDGHHAEDARRHRQLAAESNGPHLHTRGTGRSRRDSETRLRRGTGGRSSCFRTSRTTASSSTAASIMSPALTYPHTLVLYTYGKQLLAPGERLGYVAISPSIGSREDLRAAVLFSQDRRRLAVSQHDASTRRGGSRKVVD